MERHKESVFLLFSWSWLWSVFLIIMDDTGKYANFHSPKHSDYLACNFNRQPPVSIDEWILLVHVYSV